MNKRIGPKVNQVSNVAKHVVRNVFGGCHQHNSLPLGPIKHSSPSTKELHGKPLGSILFLKAREATLFNFYFCNDRKKKEKPKAKYRSYTEARKDREKFRKRLVEVKGALV